MILQMVKTIEVSLHDMIVFEQAHEQIYFQNIVKSVIEMSVRN
jgi:hypothetical protein